MMTPLICFFLLACRIALADDVTEPAEGAPVSQQGLTSSQNYCKQLTRPLNEEAAISCSVFNNLQEPGQWSEMQPGEFPFHAILGTDYDLHFAGAILISDQFLLSAARYSAYLITQGQPHTMAVVGSNYINCKYTQNCTEFGIVQTFFHPEYNLDKPYRHNIALHRLNASVTFSDSVRPVCLSSASVSPGDHVIVLAREKSGVKYKQNATIVEDSLCQSEEYKSTNMACLKFINGTEMEVTSGSPITTRIEGESCSQALVGIQNFFFDNTPDVQAYTRIVPYFPWIEKVVWGQ